MFSFSRNQMAGFPSRVLHMADATVRVIPKTATELSGGNVGTHLASCTGMSHRNGPLFSSSKIGGIWAACFSLAGSTPSVDGRPSEMAYLFDLAGHKGLQ